MSTFWLKKILSCFGESFLLIFIPILYILDLSCKIRILFGAKCDGEGLTWSFMFFSFVIQVEHLHPEGFSGPLQEVTVASIGVVALYL